MFYLNTAMPVNHTLVYSYLCYRYNLGEAVSRVELSDALKIHRTKTLPKIIKAFLKHELIEQLPDGLIPLDPTSNTNNKLFVFKQKGEAKNWWNKLAYYNIQLQSPASPLSALQNTLYWILTQVGKWQTYKGLSKLLVCCRGSIRNAMDKYRDYDLIAVEPVAKGFYQRTKPMPVEWTLRKDAVLVETPNKVETANKVLPQPANNGEDVWATYCSHIPVGGDWWRAYEAMRNSGMPVEHLRQCVIAMECWRMDGTDFLLTSERVFDYMAEAEKEHNGKGEPWRLFLYKVKKLIASDGQDLASLSRN